MIHKRGIQIINHARAHFKAVGMSYVAEPTAKGVANVVCDHFTFSMSFDHVNKLFPIPLYVALANKRVRGEYSIAEKINSIAGFKNTRLILMEPQPLGLQV